MKPRHVVLLASAVLFAPSQWLAFQMADEGRPIAGLSGVVASCVFVLACAKPDHGLLATALIVGSFAPMLAAFGHDEITVGVGLCGLLLLGAGELLSAAHDAYADEPGAARYLKLRLISSLRLVASAAAAVAVMVPVVALELPGGVALMAIAALGVAALAGLIASAR